MKRFVALIGFLLISASSAIAADGAFFQDDFDAEPAGTGLAISKLGQWWVANKSGSVDVYAQGDMGLRCRGNVGRCLDLDGTTSAAADLKSRAVSLEPGKYTLSYSLSGNQRNSDIDTVKVYFAKKLLRTVSLRGDQGYTSFLDQIDLTEATVGSIEFRQLGSDWIGLLLDDVLLTSSKPIVAGLVGGVVTYSVKCTNTFTGRTIVKKFSNLQSWDCIQMGLPLKSGQTFSILVEGQVK